MTQSTRNLRIKRMQKLLRIALMDLIKERDFDALTVGEIAEHAMMSRAGFYRYYQDKYELVEQLFEEAVCTMINELNAHPQVVRDSEETQVVPEPFVKFFEHLVEYERLYRVLLASKSRSWFIEKMHASLKEALYIRVQQSSSCIQNGKHVANAYDRLAPELAASLLIEIIIRWFEQGRPETPREIALRSSRLLSSLLKEVGTWK